MCLVGADQSICCIVSVLDSCGICCLHNILRYFGWHPAKKFHHYVKELLRKQTGYDDITFDEVSSEKKLLFTWLWIKNAPVPAACCCNALMLCCDLIQQILTFLSLAVQEIQQRAMHSGHQRVDNVHRVLSLQDHTQHARVCGRTSLYSVTWWVINILFLAKRMIMLNDAMSTCICTCICRALLSIDSTWSYICTCSFRR